MSLHETLFGRGWLEIQAPDCLISLEPRPHYCDRGEWIARVEVTGDPYKVNLDDVDLWPRYYFNLETAKSEIWEWLHRRKQVPFGLWEVKFHDESPEQIERDRVMFEAWNKARVIKEQGEE